MAPDVQIPEEGGGQGEDSTGPSPPLPVSHLHWQLGSLVLQVHHGHRHSPDGAQDARQRCGLGREQLAEHWGSRQRLLRRPSLTISPTLLGISLPQDAQLAHGMVLLAQKPQPASPWVGKGGGYLKLEEH